MPLGSKSCSIRVIGVFLLVVLASAILFSCAPAPETLVSNHLTTTPTAFVQSTIAVPSPTQRAKATPTLRVIMGVPNEVTPPPTYAVGPTAQFIKLLSTSGWRTYEDKEVGFSVKYPPDWYFKTAPQEQRANGSTTSLYSYNPEDMNLRIASKSGMWPPNFVKMEITFFLPESTGHPRQENQSIADWVRANYPNSEDEKIILEYPMEIDGVNSLERIIETHSGPVAWRRWRAIYLPVGKQIMVIGHPYENVETISKRILETIVFSIRFIK